MKHNTKHQGFFYNSLRGIKLIWSFEKKMFVLGIIYSMLHGISWVLQIVTAQLFFDQIVKLSQKEQTMKMTFFYLVLMIVTFGITQLMNGLDSANARSLNIKMRGPIQSLVLERINQMNPIEFEQPKKLDDINKAINGGENILSIVLTLTDTLTFYGTYFIFLGWYLFTLKPILIVSIAVVFIPSLISFIMQLSMFERLEEDAAPLRRQQAYYQTNLVDTNEIRLLGANDYFLDLFTSNQKELHRINYRVVVKKNIFSILLELLTVVGYGIIIYMTVILTLKQEISVGAFAAVIASISSIFNFMSEVISERIGWAMGNIPSVANFYRFIASKSIKQKMAIQQGSTITLENVCFKYPEATKNSLEQVNLVIQENETLAIVGENGCGKTTLCHILVGLYEPTVGQIKYGEKFEVANRKNISAIFQNYGRYKFSVRDNIRLSEFEKKVSDQEILKLCKDYRIYLDNPKFDKGLDTMLGRDFEGVELSGGQWQRVAIARGMYRDSRFIILDEPTSAIDPIEETKLYQEFLNICHDKTAIIVAHRLNSIKFADKIIVMKTGKIIEEGTHQELMSFNGEYKKMFKTQRKWYK